jgi:hypothetical protein
VFRDAGVGSEGNFPRQPLPTMRITTFLPILLMGATLAQAPVTFTVDTAASQWAWSGTSSLGPINGNPSNSFALQGTFVMELTSGAQGVQTGRFLPGGAAAVVPDLSGVIPNPLPFLPPLATIDVTGLVLEFTSDTFTVATSGAFNALGTTTALSGTLTVAPLTGGTTVTDLTGFTGAPQPIPGTLSASGGTVSLSSTNAGTFSFSDPASGVSADFNLSGVLAGSWTAPAPANYCTGAVNSTGNIGQLALTGSQSLSADQLILSATGLPTSQFAYFIVAPAQGFIATPPGSQGNICLSGGIGRYNALVGQTDGAGTFSRDLGVASIPVNPAQAPQPGETWYFQLWHRDANPTPTSNFTVGLELTFAP